MNIRQKLIEKCKEHGVMLLVNDDRVSIDAPVGFVFTANDNHSVTIYRNGWKIDEIYEELYEDVKMGVTECDDVDCDCCVHECSSFEELHKLYGGERLA